MAWGRVWPPRDLLTSAGDRSHLALAPKIEGIENVSFNDFTFGVDTTGLIEANNTFQGSDNFSQGHRARTPSRRAAEFHFDQVNIKSRCHFNGAFSFHGSGNRLGLCRLSSGRSQQLSQGIRWLFTFATATPGSIAQDSWRVTPRVTLNYGLRWDMLPPWREKYNQLQTLVLGEQSRVYPGAPQGLVFPGDPGVPSTLAPTRYGNFAPRVGVAYSPGGSRLVCWKIFGGPGSSSVARWISAFLHRVRGTFRRHHERQSALRL